MIISPWRFFLKSIVEASIKILKTMAGLLGEQEWSEFFRNKIINLHGKKLEKYKYLAQLKLYPVCY